MIVILSYDEFEQGTEPVVDWLINLNANFIKITIQDIYKSRSDVRIDVNEKKIYFRNCDVTGDINVIYYRRIYKKFDLSGHQMQVFRDQVEQEVTDEGIALINYLFYLLKDKVWLPPPGRVTVNKLTMVNKAQDCGFIVPRTAIINNKPDLERFYDLCDGQVITKPIARAGYYIVGKYTYFVYVNKLDEKFVQEVPENFFPSLFQQCIETDYEVRVFYLDGDFFAVALLAASATGFVDVKQSARTDQANWVPYRLPEEVQSKLGSLFRNLNLNTGSADIIRRKDGQYVFLEINPVGQFGAPSRQGNYYLEKKVAEWLIKKDQTYAEQY